MASLARKIRTGREGANITLDASDMSAVLRQMARETKHSISSILYFAMKVFTERAQRLTPLAKKTVKTWFYFDEGTQRWKDSRQDWKSWYEGTPTKLVKKLGRSRGYARQGWREIRIKMGRSRGSGGGYYRGGDVRSRFEYKDRAKSNNPFVEGANQIPYIDKLDQKHPILHTAMHNTTVKMLQQLTRHAYRMAGIARGRR